jgi:hypothetical protein
VFARQRQTLEAQAKSDQFIALMKRKEHPHHMGMTGYADKKPGWREEERARAEVGLPDPYKDFDERERDFLYGRRLKKLKKGRPSSTSQRSRRQRRLSSQPLWPRTAGASNLTGAWTCLL